MKNDCQLICHAQLKAIVKEANENVRVLGQITDTLKRHLFMHVSYKS